MHFLFLKSGGKLRYLVYVHLQHTRFVHPYLGRNTCVRGDGELFVRHDGGLASQARQSKR